MIWFVQFPKYKIFKIEKNVCGCSKDILDCQTLLYIYKPCESFGLMQWSTEFPQTVHCTLRKARVRGCSCI